MDSLRHRKPIRDLEIQSLLHSPHLSTEDFENILINGPSAIKPIEKSFPPVQNGPYTLVDLDFASDVKRPPRAKQSIPPKITDAHRPDFLKETALYAFYGFELINGFDLNSINDLIDYLDDSDNDNWFCFNICDIYFVVLSTDVIVERMQVVERMQDQLYNLRIKRYEPITFLFPKACLSKEQRALIKGLDVYRQYFTLIDESIGESPCCYYDWRVVVKPGPWLKTMPKKYRKQIGKKKNGCFIQ